MKKRIGKRGLTLVEVVAATLIISILAAGMFGAFVGAQYIFNRTRHRIQAFTFARETVDRLYANYRYIDSQLSNGNGHAEAEVGSIVRGEMNNLSTVLTYDVSEPAANGYKEVTVRVAWTETSF